MLSQFLNQGSKLLQTCAIHIDNKFDSENSLKNFSRTEVLIMSGLIAVIATYVIPKIKNNIDNNFSQLNLNIIRNGWKTGLKLFALNSIYPNIANLSFIKNLVLQKQQKLLSPEVEKKKQILKDLNHQPITIIPVEPMLPNVIEQQVHLNMINKFTKEGKTSGTRYTHLPEELRNLFAKFIVFGITNPLHPNDWPQIRIFESEIIQMIGNQLGCENSYGFLTQGGSMSIIETMIAYIIDARKRGINNPKIAVPITGHVAFHTAAEITGCEIYPIDIDPNTKQPNIKTVRKAANNKDVCVIVCSAPDYTYGTTNNIAEICEVAGNKPVHVDCCLGSFVHLFANEAGFEFDSKVFNYQNVETVSLDTHKYGKTPKGSSLVIARNRKIAESFTHCYLDEWPGGIYAKSSLPGSQSGFNVVMTYATILYYGQKGYIEQATKIISTVRMLANKINEIEGIKTICDANDLTVVVSFAAENPQKLNFAVIGDHMNHQYGWQINILKDCCHFCVTEVAADHGNFVNDFIHDLYESVKYARENPDVKPSNMTSMVYGKLENDILPSDVLHKISHEFNKIVFQVTRSQQHEAIQPEREKLNQDQEIRMVL